MEAVRRPMNRDISRGSVSRRSMLRMLALGAAGGVLAACSQPAAPPPTAAPAKPTSAVVPPTTAPAAPPTTTAPATAAPKVVVGNVAWDAMVATARQEGKLLIATTAGTGYRTLLDNFQAAIPGISVEHSQFQSASRDFTPRLLQELKAGLYSWDMMIMPPPELLQQVRQAEGLQPIRPLMIRPEILDDNAWRGGFEAGFADLDKKWGYTGVLHRYTAVWINTDVVKDGEITGVKDLTNPKWKGKIVGGDPRTKGSGFFTGTVMRNRTGGDEILKQLYKDQEVLLSTDSRQMVELMVRERYPIGIGAMDRQILDDFLGQGLGKNLKPLDFPDCDFVTSESNHFWVMNKAAHPNAAGAFINWALTQEGSAAYSKAIGVNSRRTDVPAVDESTAITSGVNYVSSDHESFFPELRKTQDLAKALLD